VGKCISLADKVDDVLFQLVIFICKGNING
jgi:hypothetical protein